MSGPLKKWLREHIEGPVGVEGTESTIEFDLNNAQRIVLKLQLGIGNGQRPIDAIARLASTDEGSAWRYSSTEERASNLPSAPVRAFLEALDMSLHRTQGFGAQELDFLLREGGSAWVVAEDGLSLVRRVPEEEAAALAQAIKPEEEASNHLQAAWAKVYGRHPDADEAWSQAIKACEAIFIPIVEPGKPRTTLGTTLRALRQHPELFDVRLTHNPAGGSVMDELIAMLDVVWVDPNRHGGQAEPRHATIEDAENIGQLAVSWSAGRGLVSSQGSHRHSDNDAISGVRPRRPYGRLAIRR